MGQMLRGEDKTKSSRRSCTGHVASSRTAVVVVRSVHFYPCFHHLAYVRSKSKIPVAFLAHPFHREVRSSNSVSNSLS